jgi:hypothetical protein
MSLASCARSCSDAPPALAGVHYNKLVLCFLGRAVGMSRSRLVKCGAGNIGPRNSFLTFGLPETPSFSRLQSISWSIHLAREVPPCLLVHFFAATQRFHVFLELLEFRVGRENCMFDFLD